MKKARLLLGIAVVGMGMGLGGCAFYNPQGTQEVTKTEVRLEARNFVTRRLGAQGVAERAYLFGLPMGPTVVGIPMDNGYDIQARAWEDLNANWDGQGSCIFHNINREWSSYGVPMIYIIHQNTITADIYEFNDEYVDYASRGERGL